MFFGWQASNWQNPYRMTDHGLFVAGIIHTIAPQAELHLIEVLNPYGVGDLESITRAYIGCSRTSPGSRL
jgi:hypothetical protein